jgi:hypothetical protein
MFTNLVEILVPDVLGLSLMPETLFSTGVTD